MKRLSPETVPQQDRHRFMFSVQQYVNKTPKERTLAIGVYCDNYRSCRNGLMQRVTKVRSKIRRGEPLVFLCEKCRVGRKYETKDGYVIIYQPDHPNAHRNGSIYEHVYVMSEKLGRPLTPGENVHHLNGVRNDNRLENLEVWSTVQPAGQRLEDKIRWAIELHQAYPDLWEKVLNDMKEESVG